ncbi:hypothetical protein GCM10009037_01260 [Halarchaeum grantii]|uniref:site-specific DNA-methyltransferase (adenine-specific) n=1 Tax=Halarchaeum grantii TaxID=1193105 RepID=A0A830EY69_9EURY|nr:TaqI-like C-terminal specificity domain-containing protein [Halarchaeum grantii]GGL21698.1 hypothetical protein GCM10009037_01260 [Halarchaeum grantii]
MSQATLGSAYQNSSLFSGYYLDERVYDLDGWDCDEGAREALAELRELWDLERDLVASYKEDELLDSWIDEVLDILGFGTLSETTLPAGGGYNDRLLFESADVRRKAATRKRDGDQDAAYNLSAALLEAKQWDADFTTRFSEQRSYRDASHQIKYYLEHTPEDVEWGVLTNGRKWRLYGTKDYATEIYYEVDLPELLESGTLEQFKYFYVFFRPEAFRKTSGTSFLDTVWNESETASQELGEDLQGNVFTALRILGEGFLRTNDGLELDPEDEDDLAELKEQSLVLLYRLMFVLYAESRDLIHPENPAMRDEYDQHFGLNHLRSRIHEDVQSGDDFEDYSEISTQMWGRLDELFTLIDEGEESLGIPPYNGGLFDADDHEFLAEHAVADRYIAEVIYRIGTTETEDGEFVLADYADLDTRHLGTIYEGLLEHEFRIAPDEYAAVSEDGGQVWKPATEVSVADAVETVDEGDLYVVNDDGERKATGAYYTPDYIVSYIVEESVGSLVDDIEADLEVEGLSRSDSEYFRRFWQEVLDLKILDPAMGSAHFLTAATGYLTERVMAVVREQEIQGYSERDLRREIARECIYGVDINGMAVELAKLSMWLETLATDQPLAFLDHHLKSGNSLIGSDIAHVLDGDLEGADSGQLTLQQSFEHTRARALEHVLERFTDLLSIENETLDGIKRMEAVYEDIRSDPLYQHLLSMANVHTADEFGLHVPSDAYNRMAESLRDDSWGEIEEQGWFEDAQKMADEREFFHWELEYPMAFYGEDGTKLDDAGFDAVIGNPPYIRIQELRNHSPGQAEYFNRHYASAVGSYDVYVVFTEKGHSLLSDRGELGYIEPHKFFQSTFGEGIRRYISERGSLKKILSFGHDQVFPTASVYTCLLFLSREASESFEYDEVSPETLLNDELIEPRTVESDYGSEPWVLQTEEIMEVLQKIDDAGPTLSEVCDRIYQGLVTSGDSIYLLEKLGEPTDGYVRVRCREDDSEWVLEEELLRPLLKGEDVHRYAPLDPQNVVIFPYTLSQSEDGAEAEFVEERDLAEKYPHTYEYLKEFETEIRGRENGKMDHDRWYDYVYPKNLTEFEQEKIVTPEISRGSNFTYDDSGYYHKTKVYGILIDGSVAPRRYVLSILNSSVLWFFLKNTGYALRGGYFTFKTDYLNPFSIPEVSQKSPGERERDYEPAIEAFLQGNLDRSKVIETAEENTAASLGYLSDQMMELNSRYHSINRSLLDHLGNYTEGPNLPDIGLFQPTSSNILDATAEDYEKLRVGDVETERDGSSVTLSATARYKPEDEDAFETDQWEYTETGYEEAFTLTDLTEVEAALVEAFVPVAAEEADGFAGFRDNATKTNSPIDRLKAITLPDPDDVADDLERYLQAKERADELDEKIEKTDDLIDEIVYDLYGLSEEEIEIVESSVRND